MKNRTIIFTLALLAMSCFIVAMVPVGAQAQAVDCIAVLGDPGSQMAKDDFDGDGLNNLMECRGFVQSDGVRIESCVDPSTPDPQATRARCFDQGERQNMVDPETKDIFVMLVASGPYDDSEGTHTSFIKDPNGNFFA